MAEVNVFKEAYNAIYKQLICEATGTRKLRIFGIGRRGRPCFRKRLSRKGLSPAEDYKFRPRASVKRLYKQLINEPARRLLSRQYARTRLYKLLIFLLLLEFTLRANRECTTHDHSVVLSAHPHLLFTVFELSDRGGRRTGMVVVGATVPPACSGPEAVWAEARRSLDPVASRYVTDVIENALARRHEFAFALM